MKPLYEIGFDVKTGKYMVVTNKYNGDSSIPKRDKQWHGKESDAIVVGIDVLRARLRTARKQEKGK